MKRDNEWTLRTESASGHNWASFGPCFVGFFPYISHDDAPLECGWDMAPTLKETTENYRKAEAPFVSQIGEIIHTISKTGSASTTSEAVRYFLGLRGAVLEPLFLKFAIPSRGNGQVTIIPFPSLPILRIVEWFCIDWWQHWGPSRVAELRHLEAFYDE